MAKSKKPVVDSRPKEAPVDMTKIASSEGQHWVTVGKNLLAYAKESRRKYDWDWLVRNLYLKGYHYANYNRRSGTVTFGNSSGVRIPINLTWAHARAVRNQVTSFRPKWEVLPAVTTESAMENAIYSQKLLDYVYDMAGIKRSIKEVVTQSLWASLGIWQFDVRKDKMISVRSVDPFDFYIDPNCNSANINDPEYGAEFVLIGGSYPLDAVKNDPNYENTEDLNAQTVIASAEYKAFLLQVTKNRQERQSDEAPTCMKYQLWKREYQDGGGFKMRVVTFTDQNDKPLKVELTDEQEYPFEVYQGDLSPLDIYGESWIKHLIPVNRVIDALESHIFEYNHLFARGRFVIDKNSGVRVIVNQHGQIIEKNRGAQVTSLPISPLPNSPREQILAFRGYMEDISGAHDVTMGRVPAGVRSGTGIAELRQADATNQDDMVDNLEDFLSRSGRKILKLIAQNWDTTKLIQVTGKGGIPEYFMAVGSKASRISPKKQKEGFKFGEMQLPIAIIGEENEVRVRVGSWLAYTKEARQERLRELFRLGAIDQRTLLENLEFGDIDAITKRTRDEKLMQLRSGTPSNSVLRTTGRQDISDEELALAENELMTEGKDQPVAPDDDHQIHVAVHKEVADNKKFGEIVRAHINEHINQEVFNRSSSQVPPNQAGGEPPSGAGGGGMPTPPETGGQVPLMAGNGVPTPDLLMQAMAQGGGQTQ